MKQILLCSILLFLFSGCADLAEHAPDIQGIGQAAAEVGTILTPFQPEIAVWVILAGGILTAIGKALSSKEK